MGISIMIILLAILSSSIEKVAIAKYIKNPDEYQIVTNNADKTIIKINK